MKIIAINGSPRKKWNSSKLLNSWKEGVLSVIPDAEIKEVNLYDLDYKGCRSCFACKLKGGKFYGTCPIKDGIHDLLADIREADAVAIASPIYYLDIDAYTKCLLERMLFSVSAYSNPSMSLAPKRVSFTMLYSMNVNKEGADSYGITARCKAFESFLGMIYFMPVHSCTAYNTYQFPDYSKYESSAFSEEEKRQTLENQFPKDLQGAFEEGCKVAREILEPSFSEEIVDRTLQYSE